MKAPFPVYMLRHAETDNNLSDITQSQLNKHDVTISGKLKIHDERCNIWQQLHNYPLCHFVVSPAKRARTTAELLYGDNAIYVKEHVDARLLEVNFGVYAGEHTDYIYRGLRLHDYNALIESGRDWQFPDGESKSDIEKRCRLLCQDIAKLQKTGVVVLVGHCRMFRHLRQFVTGIKPFSEPIPHLALLPLAVDRYL